MEYFQAKWNHLAARKIRPNNGWQRVLQTGGECDEAFPPEHDFRMFEAGESQPEMV